MSTDPTGQARTARVVGLTLLAVAAAAAVIGVITLFDTGEEAPPSAQAPQTTVTTTQPAPPSGDLTSLPPRPTTPGLTSAQPTTTAQPPVTSAPPVSTAPPVTTKPGNTADAPSEPLRIYNNSTVAGLAARAAEDIGSAGWKIAQTGNYSGGKIPTTTVYFEPGTSQEAAARQLADQFGFRVEARFDGIKDASPGLILIVTNDYKVVKEK
ncbi:type IV secretory pathway VirB10-like protein [Actinokineospora baliensis]|uniref:LytR C-terminal domain-containing protein n=1 Tax=Actinokineospora baliensis TaxID=547056 RepID=UPI00195E13EB|nr:LytR C-terminal domain-containing protein [Actinokineospora baliensis]MBM7771541.1 type IV secretory pathway VirB10-like protein [Actinokineospora baliensis]